VITSGLWEILQAFGSRYVVHEVQHGSALYGIFGVVLATIAWIYLVALVVMISAEINVVWHRRLWPRSVLSPFTDHMSPTPADLAAYRAYAQEPRFKGWERIEVDFSPPDMGREVAPEDAPGSRVAPGRSGAPAGPAGPVVRNGPGAPVSGEGPNSTPT
jgi:hypothetical protein